MIFRSESKTDATPEVAGLEADMGKPSFSDTKHSCGFIFAQIVQKINV
jgi:hypothetical protein